MKKYLIIFMMMLAVSVYARGPKYNLKVDVQFPSSDLKPLEMLQGAAPAFDVYIKQDGSTYTNIASDKCIFAYGESGTAAAFVFLTNDTITAASGIFHLNFTAANLNTNGDFWYTVLFLDASDNVYYAGDGNLRIKETTVTGSPGTIDLSTPLNWTPYLYENTASDGPCRAGTNTDFSVNADGSVNIDVMDGILPTTRGVTISGDGTNWVVIAPGSVNQKYIMQSNGLPGWQSQGAGNTNNLTNLVEGIAIKITGNGASRTIAHSNTSDIANIDLTNGYALVDMTFDSLGHPQTSGSYDFDGRYYREAEVDTIVLNATNDLYSRIFGEIGSVFQGYDIELAALAGLTSAGDKLPYFTGSGTAALADLSSYMRGLLNPTNEAAFHALINLEIGVDVQDWAANLDGWALISTNDLYTLITYFNNGSATNAELLNGDNAAFYRDFTNGSNQVPAASASTLAQILAIGADGNVVTITNLGHLSSGGATYDLGSLTRQWKDIFIGGQIYMDTKPVISHLGGDNQGLMSKTNFMPFTDSLYQLGNTNRYWLNFFTDMLTVGAGTITESGGILNFSLRPTAGTTNITLAGDAINDNQLSTNVPLLNAEQTFSASQFSSVDHSVNAPSETEFPTAGWVRGLTLAGQQWFLGENVNTSAWAKTTNFVDLLTVASTNLFTNSIASPITSDTYFWGGMTTSLFSDVRSPIGIEVWLARVGGNASSILPVHPEVYYVYNGQTNQLGDWEVENQLVGSTDPTKFTFSISLFDPMITGSVYIVSYLKSGTVSGSAAGIDISGGGVRPSHIDLDTIPSGESFADALHINGNNAMTGNLNAGGNKGTNVADAVAEDDWTAFKQAKNAAISTNNVWSR